MNPPEFFDRWNRAIEASTAFTKRFFSVLFGVAFVLNFIIYGSLGYYLHGRLGYYIWMPGQPVRFAPWWVYMGIIPLSLVMTLFVIAYTAPPEPHVRLLEGDTDVTE